MRSDIDLNKIRQNTFKKLLDALNPVLSNNSNFRLNINFKQQFKEKPLTIKILINSVFECIFIQIKLVQPHEKSIFNQFNQFILEKLQNSGIESVKNFKEELKENFRSSILNKDYDYSDLELFSFNNQNKFLKTDELVEVFKSQIHPIRWKKFQFLVKQEGINRGLDSDTIVSLSNAFPDAQEKFIKLIRNRIKLYYVEQVINYLEENEEQIKLKGNIEIFKPDSEFAKIYNKFDGLENLPKLIFKFIEETEYKRENPFFERLNIFLRHCKYNGRYLMLNSAQSKYSDWVGKYLGKKYKYEKDKFDGNIYDEFEKKLIYFLKANKLDIKGMYS